MKTTSREFTVWTVGDEIVTGKRKAKVDSFYAPKHFENTNKKCALKSSAVLRDGAVHI